ncbi:MAG: glucose-1-phosphate adenylyltransferase, partial [Gammaproteobacteria bacterium]
EWTIILSGDHIYRMDYASILKTHQMLNADATIACMKVPIESASQFGIVTADAGQKITRFQEKPDIAEACTDDEKFAMASMGIYIFSTKLLIEILEKDSKDESSSHDFGKDILPGLIDSHKLCAHYFGESEGRVSPDNYWRDVGTIDSFYQANMDLLNPVPAMDLYQRNWPIRSYQSQTPPARAVPGNSGTEGVFINSMLSGGTVISGGNVDHSILFQNVFIDDQALVTNSVIFGHVKIGRKVRLNKCIVDKHVTIPDGEIIGFDPVKDSERFTVTENGIVVIPKDFCF